MKSIFTIALLTAGLQALHLNTEPESVAQTNDIIASIDTN